MTSTLKQVTALQFLCEFVVVAVAVAVVVSVAVAVAVVVAVPVPVAAAIALPWRRLCKLPFRVTD